MEKRMPPLRPIRGPGNLWKHDMIGSLNAQPRRVMGVNELLNPGFPTRQPQPQQHQEEHYQYQHDPESLGKHPSMPSWETSSPSTAQTQPHFQRIPDSLRNHPGTQQSSVYNPVTREPSTYNVRPSIGYQAFHRPFSPQASGEYEPEYDPAVNRTETIFPHSSHESFNYLPPLMPENFAALPRIRTNSTSINSTHNAKRCMICLEEDNPGDEIDFPHSCSRCSFGNVCAACLKNWFLDACKNESKMPPTCCSIIPLSSVSRYLTGNEIELYKAKYEEWSTPDRLYCPKPTCSTFIPPRHLLDPITSKMKRGPSRQISTRHNQYTDHSQLSLSGSGSYFENTLASPSYRKARAETPPFILQQKRGAIKPHVKCPTCTTEICTRCRSFFHLGSCPKSDIDPELEAQLKVWKVKRCPKCRTGVRKMFGCSHIECRCGAHFCWECLLPINECDGQCDDGFDPYDVPEGYFAEDDLDGRASRGMNMDDQDALGGEPYGPVVEQGWACNHSWIPALQTSSDLGKSQRVNWECHRCFRVTKIGDVLREEQTIESVTTLKEAGWPFNTQGIPVWQCVNLHVRCYQCSKHPPAHRLGDSTRKWRCDCGHECMHCDKHEIMKFGKDERDEIAWECRCGIIICGHCKESDSS